MSTLPPTPAAASPLGLCWVCVALGMRQLKDAEQAVANANAASILLGGYGWCVEHFKHATMTPEAAHVLANAWEAKYPNGSFRKGTT